MAATAMTVEFGAIHYYSSLEENWEPCLCNSLDGYKLASSPLYACLTKTDDFSTFRRNLKICLFVFVN